MFYETLLEGQDPPLFEDVRRASVINLAAAYRADFTHVEHVAELALEMWDGLAAAGVHDGDPIERDLLWAAAMLHDIGMAIDYDDHHKHSRYLILSAGLAGFTPRETALVGQMARYHRKGSPSHGRLRGARAQGRRRAADPLRGRAAARRAARAPARSDRPQHRRRRARRRGGAACCGPTRTSRSPAGRPSARAICSGARSGAT